MKLKEIETPVSAISGVGTQTAKLLAKLGVFTVSDLLTLWPRNYDDRTQRRSLSQWNEGRVHTIAQVLNHSWFGYGKMKTLRITISDGTAQAELVCFNRAFLEKTLTIGSVIAVTGQFTPRYNQLQCTAFDTQVLNHHGNLAELASSPIPNSKVIPVYPLTAGLNQGTVRKAVAQALKQYARGIDDELPQTVIAKRNLMHKQEAVFAMHMPENLVQAENARATFIYEELFLFQKSIISQSQARRRSVEKALALHAGKAVLWNTENDGMTEENQVAGGVAEGTAEQNISQFNRTLSPRQKQLYERLPFDLTHDQKQVIMDMNRDMDLSHGFRDGSLQSDDPFHMARLLQGDVGSGKTLVAFFMALRTIDYGGQVAILAPTEILAKQHAQNAAKQLEVLGVRVAFLTGNVAASSRKPLLAALKAGEIDILIGTHALFSQSVLYKDLQFAIIDEQHRFGVVQRNAILDKGRQSIDGKGLAPDFLLMSATPIPQTLALTVFGDLDVCTIKTMPAGRKPIVTHLTRDGNESRVYEAVRAELMAGRQAYFVYPLIDRNDHSLDEDFMGGVDFDSDGSSGPENGSGGPGSTASGNTLKSAVEMFDFLQHQVYPGFRCALIHSQVEDEEQTKILKEFREGKIQILVATSVVEVGVDVPNATCMVIECAERFGLAALHQLRGRVGRGDAQSQCFLIYGEKLTELGKSRLRVLHESVDGFFIAEEDLRLRGPGDVTGIQQSGYFTLGLSDPVRDRAILEVARTDVISELNVRR